MQRGRRRLCQTQRTAATAKTTLAIATVATALSDHGVLAGMVDVLLSVGERSLLVETVVDEVVGARAGRDLTGWKTNETGRQRERVASEQQDE